MFWLGMFCDCGEFPVFSSLLRHSSGKVEGRLGRTANRAYQFAQHPQRSGAARSDAVMDAEPCRCEPAGFVLMRSRLDSAGLRWTEMMRMRIFVT